MAAAHLREALELIGTKCHASDGPETCMEDPSRNPHAPFGADRWCDGCIARAGLSGLPFPAA